MEKHSATHTAKEKVWEKRHDFWSQPSPETDARCTQEALWLPLSSAHLVTWLAGGRRHRPCCVQAWSGHLAEAEGLGQVEVGRRGAEHEVEGPQEELPAGTPSWHFSNTNYSLRL